MALAGVRVHFAVFRNVTPFYGMLEKTILSGTAIKMIRSLAGGTGRTSSRFGKETGKWCARRQTYE